MIWVIIVNDIVNTGIVPQLQQSTIIVGNYQLNDYQPCIDMGKPGLYSHGWTIFQACVYHYHCQPLMPEVGVDYFEAPLWGVLVDEEEFVSCHELL